MIVSDTKTKSSSSAILNLSAKDEKPTLSFAELLHGVNSKKNVKLIRNGTLVLALKNQKEEKTDFVDLKTSKTAQTNAKKNDLKALASLLKNEDTATVKLDEEVQINPKIAEILSPNEIKSLLSDAKRYLRSKILESDGYKKSQIKELPKTLKGLAKLAKKFDIDISKITIEKVQTPPQQTKKSSDTLKTVATNETKTSNPHTLKTDALKEQIQETKKLDSHALKTDALKEPAREIKSQNPHAEKIEPLKEVLKESNKTKPAESQGSQVSIPSEKKVETFNEVNNVKPTQTKENKPFVADIKGEKLEDDTHFTKKQEVVKNDIHSKEIKPSSHVENTTKTENMSLDKEQEVQIKKEDQVVSRAVQEIKQTPLFKAQKTKDHSTEQFVQTKQIKVEQKSPKEKADETLKLLLQGEKPSQSVQNLTADFSVATAKVIAPKAATEGAKGVEQLLHGKENSKSSTNSEDASNIKQSEVSVPLKADSFEVKLNEAKQMIKYLSHDVKTAIDEYKSPFTRIKVQLNPQKLGELDLTVVQRGKNLHVNISSNNTAINTLSLNANELRTQLSNNGINNATLNFSNSSSDGSSNSSAQQQQQQQNQKQANEEYNYFNSESESEEILSSLEIVVPRYI